MGQPGVIRISTRSDFEIVESADLHKYEGQTTIGMVAGLDPALAERIVSRPASGHRQIYNITYDPHKEELIIEMSDTDES